MKEYSIGTTCSPCVGFKYGCHEDKGIPCVLASRSSVWRYICDMIKKKKWRWSSYVELNISHALAYVLSNGWSRSWVNDFKRRIHDMALSWCHDSLMSWAMFDHDLEHAIKWRVLYVSQDIVIEHEEIQGWSRQIAMSGIKLVNTQNIKVAPQWIIWSCGMVSFVNYALWTNPSYMCICVVYVG